MSNRNNEDKENEKFLRSQIITYLGNKRKLLKYIEQEIIEIQKKLNKTKTVNLDLFSGSGIVARLFKKYSQKLIVNDIEFYSYVLNDCYLTNKKDFNLKKYNMYKNKILEYLNCNLIKGIISKNYAPKNSNNIKKNERVFFTTKNANFLDTIRQAIGEIVEKDYQKFFIAPLIVEASIKNNTAGVFKGFYKDKITKIGKFGGSGQNALSRITQDITLNCPILSNFSCEIHLYQSPANELVKQLKNIDIAYIDPPYNQHPYGSNYFMLNIIAKNQLNAPISKISGIPENWNRSFYNYKKYVYNSFEDLIKNLNAKYIIISYNSEGFLTKIQIEEICQKYGLCEVKPFPYLAFRGSRNLNKRNLHIKEYLFILEKKENL